MIRRWVMRLLERSADRRRQLDIDVLWPAIKAEAEKRGQDIDDARLAFLAHASQEPDWIVFGPEEMKRRVRALS